MARLEVADMKKIFKDRNTVHGVVDSSYTTFEDCDEKYFQIDMYGSGSRKDKGKISQTIQIDKNNAILLIELLKREFSL